VADFFIRSCQTSYFCIHSKSPYIFSTYTYAFAT